MDYLVWEISKSALLCHVCLYTCEDSYWRDASHVFLTETYQIRLDAQAFTIIPKTIIHFSIKVMCLQNMSMDT